MRSKLGNDLGVRARYKGTVSRFGTKPAFRGPPQPTLLLTEIIGPDGAVVADHLWLTVGKQIARLNAQIGQVIEFDARVTEYEKGYKGRRVDVYAPVKIDFRLSFPTNFEIVAEAVQNSTLEPATD